MKQTFLTVRRFVGRHLPISWARRLLVAEEIFLWVARIRPKAPPHSIKALIIGRFARRYGLRTFIETGTYLGDMVAALHNRFDRVISIELSPELHRTATKRFSDVSNVELHLGDSSVVLPRVLATISSPSLFWLDAHFSAGITAKGDLDSPIAQEMHAVLDHPIESHVVLIDDARLFRGNDGYPTLAELEQMVRERRPNARFDVKKNIIRITPRSH